MTDDQFVVFWKAYPRKVGKFLAQKMWVKIKEGEDLFEKIIKNLEIQKQSDGWQKESGTYIPHPSTWLNQRRWEDEVQPGRNVRQIEAGASIDPAKVESAKQKMRELAEREWDRRQTERRESERRDKNVEDLS